MVETRYSHRRLHDGKKTVPHISFTHCDLLTPYEDIDSTLWLVAWRHNAPILVSWLTFCTCYGTRTNPTNIRLVNCHGSTYLDRNTPNDKIYHTIPRGIHLMGEWNLGFGGWRVRGGYHILYCSHYTDVIMTTMASQITSFTVVYSSVYSDADQRKHQSSASLAFVWGIHRKRWIPRTKGQLRGKCFHLVTSSW